MNMLSDSNGGLPLQALCSLGKGARRHIDLTDLFSISGRLISSDDESACCLALSGGVAHQEDTVSAKHGTYGPRANAELVLKFHVALHASHAALQILTFQNFRHNIALPKLDSIPPTTAAPTSLNPAGTAWEPSKLLNYVSVTSPSKR
jgi:hypothetical protein